MSVVGHPSAAVRVARAVEAYCGWCHGFDGPPSDGRPAVVPTVGLVFGAARSEQRIRGLRVVTSVDAASGLVVFRPAGTGRAMLPAVGAHFDGNVLTRPDVYRSAAASFGLDADVVAAGFDGRDVEALRRNGVTVTVLHGRHRETPEPGACWTLNSPYPAR